MMSLAQEVPIGLGQLLTLRSAATAAAPVLAV